MNKNNLHLMIMTKREEADMMDKVIEVADKIDKITNNMEEKAYILKKLVEGFEEYFDIDIPCDKNDNN